MRPEAEPRRLVSVGVFAHNEEGSVEACLESVLASRLITTGISEVLVVSSGSTDGTDDVVESVARRQPLVRLLKQGRKEGKASAVNLFLEHANLPCCVLVNADTILHEDAIEALCAPLGDASIGMVGGRPVPVARSKGPIGYAQGLFWELHHGLCLKSPKMGELVAFRRVFDRLPAFAGADEDWIHGEVRRRGLRAAYAPDAVAYNRAPANLAELVAHRRRLAVQHRVLARRQGFSPSSRSHGLLLRVTLDHLRRRPAELPALAAVGTMEVAARVWAAVSYFLRGETCANWVPLRSSKGITPGDVRRLGYRAR